MFERTRDGFMFLVMGFTGAEAARTKEAFITAFNAMEDQFRTLERERLARPVPALFDAQRPDTPFGRLDSNKYRELRKSGKTAVVDAYLLECGITPDYIATLHEQAGLPLTSAKRLGGPGQPEAAPLSLLAALLPEAADRQDGDHWFLLRPTMERRDPLG